MSTGNVASFTGVLVSRHYKPGQKYVQFVFQTAEGIRLSLSRNAQMVRTLDIGQKYSVEGQEYAVGKKTFVHEPTTLPIQTRAKTSFGKGAFDSRLIIAAAILVPVAGIASAVYFTASDIQGRSQANTRMVTVEETLGASSTNTQSSKAVSIPVSNSQPDAATQSASQPQPGTTTTPRRMSRSAVAEKITPPTLAITPAPQASAALAVSITPPSEAPQPAPEPPLVAEDPAAVPPTVGAEPSAEVPATGEPPAGSTTGSP